MRVTDFCYTFHGGVAVDHDGVCREAMRREELFAVGRPLDGGDLGRCGERMEACACSGIPDMNGGVVCTSA